MPQLDFATYASQIFWLAIIFSALFWYLSKGPIPVIREVLQNRQARILSDLKKAETLKQEAEATQSDFTSIVEEAKQNAHTMISEARAIIDGKEAERNAKIQQNFVQQSKEAERRVASLRKETAEKLVPVAADAAILIADKLIGIKIDKAEAVKVATSLSDEAIGLNKN